MIKIALAQINACVGDLEKNAHKIIANIRAAKDKGVDMVIFPELALVGYPPEDLLLKPYFIEENLRYRQLIKKECRGIIAFVGFVDKLKDKIYNSCAFIQNGQIRDIYHKIYLPNYGVFHLGKLLMRERYLSDAARQTHAAIFYCDLVGGQDELIFDGTSMVLSPEGKVLKYAKRFKEDLLIFTFKKNYRHPCVKLNPKEDAEVFLALRLGLYDYVHKNGFHKVMVGVSGGVDSAVVIALAVLALGRDNVYGFIMPSRYTSKETLSDAEKVCKNLGVKYHSINIDEIFECYLKDLAPFFKDKKRDKTEENLQARIRGNLLMAFSNKFGSLILNTGNKSEVSCGYCTLYGDMVGGFGILKDIPKLSVYRLAHYINRVYGKKVIPLSVIKRAPSAELKPNQKDEDTLPPYKLLDPIIKLYVEENRSLEEIARLGFKKKVVKKVIAMVDGSEYKRRQAPIGIKITPRAFGKDRRMPITNKFNY
jgi:NAD+ synthase (glutamine-hydrolysing)